MASTKPKGRCPFCKECANALTSNGALLVVIIVNVRIVSREYLYTAGLVAIIMQGLAISGMMNFARIALAY